MSHEFVKYGPGVRKIVFLHAGKDLTFWKGHYGSKMAGACILIKIPNCPSDVTEEDAMDILD